MDPQGHDFMELILRRFEVALGNEREKTRITGEWLMADRAAMEAKEKERSMLLKEKDRMLAVKVAEEKLVADFLEADGNKNFDGQKAMMDEIVALMSRDGGDSSNAGGAGGVYGENINYLENTQNQEEGAMMATVEGKNGGGE